MISKFNNLFLILGVILSTLILSNCYKQERYILKEGKYEYTDEQIDFYEDVKISYISLEFVRKYDIEDWTNILVNRKNNYIYYVDFYIESEEGEGVSCPFIALPKDGDQIDRYYIDLDLSNYINADNAIITMVLEIDNPGYYKNKDKSNYMEATQIFIEVKRFTIDKKNITEYSFPSRILLKYIEEE